MFNKILDKTSQKIPEKPQNIYLLQDFQKDPTKDPLKTPKYVFNKILDKTSQKIPLDKLKI